MTTPDLDKPVSRKERLHIDGANYLPSYFSHINNRLSSGASQLYLRLYGIGINEWRILSVLSNWPHSTAGTIGDTVGMHKTVVSRSLRDMEAKALLTIDSGSGQRLMALTPAGQQLHDQIAAVALERERLLMRGFSAEERQQLVALLRRTLDNVDAVNAWDPQAQPLPRAAARTTGTARGAKRSPPSPPRSTPRSTPDDDGRTGQPAGRGTRR